MMRICTNCVLPESLPGIKFDESGICNFCKNFKGKKNLEEKKLRFKEKFENLIEELRGEKTYDALMSYSGGKDSSYTLAILKENYNLNILAVTFNNGFLPPQTLKNIENVTEKLKLDHIMFKPRFDILKKIFVACSKRDIFPPATLIRASSICTFCMGIVKSWTLRIALEKDIPFIIFGWSPGQIPLSSSIMKNNPSIVKSWQKAFFGPLTNLGRDELKPYFLEERHYKGDFNFPYNLSPLAFLDYDENKIFKKVMSLGWRIPDDIDSNTTNCLLNSFANVVHKERHGYHPYSFEMAKLVREGYMERSLALRKLNEPEKIETVELVKKILGI